jgi:hypothetical protein
MCVWCTYGGDMSYSFRRILAKWCGNGASNRTTTCGGLFDIESLGWIIALLVLFLLFRLLMGGIGS